jgi:hypothetical protein
VMAEQYHHFLWVGVVIWHLPCPSSMLNCACSAFIKAHKHLVAVMLEWSIYYNV